MAHKRYQHCDRFFSDFTRETCYWAGFIAADGNVYLRRRGNYVETRLRLGVSSIDLGHLHKFRRCLASDHNVSYYAAKDFYALSIYGCPQILIDLQSKYGIVPRKSFILQAPRLLDENHIRHFVRGYLDGDGSIWSEMPTRVNKRQWRVAFAGTEELLSWIKNCIQQFVPGSGNPTVRPVRSYPNITYQLVFGGQQVFVILKWLYAGSTEYTRLDRKYQLYREVTR